MGMTNAPVQDDDVPPGWVSHALTPDYARAARADIDLDLSAVPVCHDGLRLTPAGHQLLGWWFDARGDNPMPLPADVSPKRLRQLLPYIRYMSWDGPEELLIRVFGSALAEGIGIDLTGTRMFAGAYNGRDLDIARMKMLHEVPCGGIMIRDLPDMSGDMHPCELVTLPVAAGEDGAPRLIGTVMPTKAPDTIWTRKVDYAGDISLRRATFIDLGSGLPDRSSGLFL